MNTPNEINVKNFCGEQCDNVKVSWHGVGYAQIRDLCDGQTICVHKDDVGKIARWFNQLYNALNKSDLNTPEATFTNGGYNAPGTEIEGSRYQDGDVLLHDPVEQNVVIVALSDVPRLIDWLRTFVEPTDQPAERLARVCVLDDEYTSTVVSFDKDGDLWLCDDGDNDAIIVTSENVKKLVEFIRS